jgi:hypothetical protein
MLAGFPGYTLNQVASCGVPAKCPVDEAEIRQRRGDLFRRAGIAIQ